MTSDSVTTEPARAGEGFRGLGAPAMPLAWLYDGVVRLRNMTFELGLRKVFEPEILTISVGGIEAGGVGKSPVAQHLLRALVAQGRRPALISRGYGRRSQGVVLRRPGEPAPAALIGDEPAMMVRSGLDVPVAVCGRRKDAVMAVQREALADVLVLDDGFAHRALRRHVEVVVLRAEAPLGNGMLLPAGTLREAPHGLRRADVLWFHDKRALADEDAIARVCSMAPNAQCVRSTGMVLGALDGRGHPVEGQGRRVVAAAGIARPADLEHTLVEAGFDVAFTSAFADHHVFSERDVEALTKLRDQHGADAVVVTSKDAVKLEPWWQSDPERWWVLDYGVQITSGQEALGRVLNGPA